MVTSCAPMMHPYAPTKQRYFADDNRKDFVFFVFRSLGHITKTIIEVKIEDVKCS